MSQTNPPQPLPSQVYCAAEMLEDVVLHNGWKVLKKVPKANTATGGCFSVQYFVEHNDGKKTHLAFLKALNFRQLLAQSDVAKAMEQHTRAFNFEKETLEMCRGKNLKRIARLIESGQYNPANCPWPVSYIIFELADGGDARQQLAKMGAFDLAWTLRTLHQVAVGLQQLHSEGIAHQDLKPSNVIFFESFGAKLADLGCADTKHKPSESPRGHMGIAGDPNYAPPELIYNELSNDWKTRRLGCDHYLLGSLIVFFFTGGVSFNAILRQKVHPQHSPIQWPHDYRTVLPYSFTSAPIAKALVDAYRRGVKVQVILDKSQRTEKYSSADFVSHAGILTYIDAQHAIAHNKIMVIDGHEVLTGSFNFTTAAEKHNAENLLVIEDVGLAAKYTENWKHHLAHSEVYSAGEYDPSNRKHQRSRSGL